jgi:lipopolysaccharide/colanic/teichoic acid biosynthesis glycosyltransferase
MKNTLKPRQTKRAARTRVRPGLPHEMEAAVALGALVVVSPLLAVAAAGIALSSPGPIVFKQKRIGKNGRAFTMFKLRTMQVQNSGPQMTAKNDNRITPIGKILRKTKMDEVPELWNIVRGDMSFVGPRPEVPHYIDLNEPLWDTVLRARPGLTDPVTLKLRNEEELLEEIEGDRETFYREVLQPYKLRGYAAYLQRRSWLRDIGVLLKTLYVIAQPHRAAPPTREEIEAASTRK